MVTKSEWTEYFEAINGRVPTLAEFQEAKKNGEFADTQTSATSSQTEEEKTILESQPNPVTATSSKKNDFTNYYEELDLLQSSTVDNINNLLDEKFNEARSRIQKMPDKYKKIMNLVEEARKVFDTDESKAKYDKELEEANKIPEVVEQIDERVLKFNNLFKSVQKYYFDGVYDLASEELEEMEKYRDAMPEDEIDSRILAGWIYNDSQQYQKSLKSVNKAIILQPNFPHSHRLKFIAMYNIDRSSDERKDKATRFTKANELGNLLKKYIEAAKNWKYSTEEIIKEAEDFAAGWYFFGISKFYNQEEEMFYSNELVEDEQAKIGKGLADNNSSMPDSACVLEAHELALERRDVFQKLEGAQKVLNGMTEFKISENTYKLLGIVIVIGVVTLSSPIGVLLLLGGIGGIIAVFVNKNQRDTAYKEAQAAVEKQRKRRDVLWSEGILPAYNKWKKRYFG